jgi:hypothetical protein
MVGLVLKVGFFSALLVTVLSAGTIALFTGTGTLEEWGHAGETTRSWIPNPIEVGKAAVLLCPITVVLCGPFGLAAGIAGASLLYLRRRRVHSTRWLMVEAATLGFLLGCLCPVLARPFFLGGLFMLIRPFFGVACAIICARVFRDNFMVPLTT